MVTTRMRMQVFFLLLSLLIHCGALIIPGLEFKNEHYNDREIQVLLEMEKPSLLPRIDEMANKRKLQEVPQSNTLLPPEQDRDHLEEEHSELAFEKKKQQTVPQKKHMQEQVEVVNPDDEAMLRYQDMIKQKIESCRRYPRWARRNRLEGVSYVAFTLLSNGTVKDVDLVRSSGSKVLDTEAVATVSRAMPFKPIPEKFNCTVLRMEIGFEFDLK